MKIVGIPESNTNVNCITIKNEFMQIALERSVAVSLPETTAKNTEQSYMLYRIVDGVNENNHLLSYNTINNDDVLQLL